MGMSTSGRYGNIAWYERRPDRRADCGQWVETYPARSVRLVDGVPPGIPVCRRHATPEEIEQRRLHLLGPTSPSENT